MEETVLKRLEVYEESTSPLIGFYEGMGKLVKVHGIGESEEISKRVFEALNEVRI